MRAAVFVFVTVLVIAAECANHSRRHKAQKNEEDSHDGAEDGVTDWPHPNSISGFQIPSIFTGGSGDGGSSGTGSEDASDNGEDGTSEKHHPRSHKRHSR